MSALGNECLFWMLWEETVRRSGWLRVSIEDKVLAELEADGRTHNTGLTNRQLVDRTGADSGPVAGVLDRLRARGKVGCDKGSALEDTDRPVRFWFLKG